MPAKNKQPFLPRLLKSKLLIIGEITLLIFISVALGKEIIRRYQIRHQIEGLQAEIQKLEQNKVELSELIEYFNSESFNEEQARLKLGLQKPGESVVVVPSEQGYVKGAEIVLDEQGIGYSNSDQEDSSNPQQWWNYFFKTKKES